MKTMQAAPALETEDQTQAGPASVPLGLGWVAAVEARERGAVFRLQNPQQGAVEVEIVLTAEGPVIRAAAAALEITSATDVTTRCERFSVDASEIALTARTGNVNIRANDDVAMNGEQILLNCDRDPPLPGWLPQPTLPEATLPAKQQDGDPDVLRALDET
jgi:hypothetical protein